MKNNITATKANGEIVKIKMSCDDECKNGHDTFSITGEVYKPNTKVFSDRNMISCGCVHDDILEARPDLKLLVDLHLSDGDGSPIFAIENGWYHLCQNINTGAKYLRISTNEANALRNGTKEDFIKWVEAHKPIWAKQAEKAKQLILNTKSYDTTTAPGGNS